MAARKGGRGPFDGGGTRPCCGARKGRKSIGMVWAGERYGFRRQNHTFWRAKGDVLEKACRCGGSRAEGKHSAAPPARAGGRGGAALWPRRRGCGMSCRRGAGGLPNLGALALGQEELVALLHLERVIPSVDVRQGGVHARLVGRVGVGGDDHVHILGAHVRSPHACP